MLAGQRVQRALEAFTKYMAAAALAEEGEAEMAREILGLPRVFSKRPRPPFPPIMFWPLLVTP